MLFIAPVLTEGDLEVLGKIEEIRRTLSYALNVPRLWTGLLRRTAFARNIMGSNSIEGYNVTLEDAIAAAEGEEPIGADVEAWQAVVGYRTALTYILQLSDDPHFEFQEGVLRALHYIMIGFDLTKHPGRWRPGSIFVRHEPSREIVYEGPPAEEVPPLMAELVNSLNQRDTTPAMVRAAMGHLNLVMIHPFSDGNGRMARALQTFILAREGILAPQFCSIEEYLGRNTPAYYDVLAEVGQGNWRPERDATVWIRFCLKAHFYQASTFLRRTREIEKLWDALEAEIRRRGLPDRTIFALADAAMGLRVRSSTYRAAAREISPQVASRDLKLLVEKKLLHPKGERRGRVYVGSPAIKALREAIREPKGIQDPFMPRQALLPFSQT
jgi:Fic family protein